MERRSLQGRRFRFCAPPRRRHQRSAGRCGRDRHALGRHRSAAGARRLPLYRRHGRSTLGRHCLGAKVLGHVAPPSAVHLLLGYASGTFTRHLQPDAIHVDPAAAANPEAHRGTDLALLHFAASTPFSLPIDSTPQIPGAPLALGGYEQDRPERLAVDPGCAAKGYQADADRKPLLLHDCTGTRGASGGAVLSRRGGIWRLAGVTEAARDDGAGGVAVPGFAVAQMLDGVR